MIIYPPIFRVFTSLPPQSGYTGVLVFFISFINSPASRTIPFFPWDALILLIDSDFPSLLKRKRQARIQVLCFFPLFLSSASSELCYWLLELLNVQIISRSVPLIPAFFGVMFIASPILLKSINSSGGKLHFPWYNLLCYSPPSCLPFYFHVQTVLKFSWSVNSLFILLCH